MSHGPTVLGDWARVPPALLAEAAGHDRGLGVTELLHGHAPAVVIVLFAIITQLGDLWLRGDSPQDGSSRDTATTRRELNAPAQVTITTFPASEPSASDD